MKKEYVIIIVAIALLAIWYFFIRKSSATTAASVANANPASLLASAGGGLTSPSTNATATGASQTIAPAIVSPLPQSGTVTGEPVDPSQYDAIILPWMNSLGVANKAQALKEYPLMSDDEKAALADIIANVWTGNRPQTQDDTDFWNAWRVEYHILDGTYSPFNGGTEDDQAAYTGLNNQFRVKGSPIDYVF